MAQPDRRHHPRLHQPIDDDATNVASTPHTTPFVIRGTPTSMSVAAPQDRLTVVLMMCR
jgi:hypothetical protein